MLWTVLIVVLLFSVLGGTWSYPRYGYYGWTPLGMVVVLLVILLLMGKLHLRI